MEGFWQVGDKDEGPRYGSRFGGFFWLGWFLVLGLLDSAFCGAGSGDFVGTAHHSSTAPLSSAATALASSLFRTTTVPARAVERNEISIASVDASDLSPSMVGSGWMVAEIEAGVGLVRFEGGDTVGEVDIV